MRPVVTLSVAVQQTRWIEAGETCGYNGNGRPNAAAGSRRCSPATPTACRAERARPTHGPGAEVVIAGRRCPLVGRISMDLCVADVTDLPEEAIKAGDRAEVFGARCRLDDFAARSGTIGYRLLTSLGPRYRREYVHDKAISP